MAWFAFDILAYDADTAHLSTIEHGAYFLLIKHYMRTRMPLLDNDQALANLTLLPLVEWLKIASNIRAFFHADEGRLYQKKCDKTLAEEDKRTVRRNQHAKMAANKRWQHKKTLHAQRMPNPCSANAQAMPNDATRPDQTRHNPPIVPQGGHVRTPKKNVLNGHLADFEAWYALYPRHVGKGKAEKAFAQALRVASLDQLCEAARRYAAEVTGKDPQYTAHPASWLNGKRWLDEQPDRQATLLQKYGQSML